MKKYNNKIDVIIPAYNVPDHILFRCLASIACQDIVQDIEVTIVDDASTEQNYDKVKLDVEIGGRVRRININNIDKLSIIEGIPDSIKQENGHADLKKYVPYVLDVINEYLDEMVLRIS